jgi:hypothetical protein
MNFSSHVDGKILKFRTIPDILLKAIVDIPTKQNINKI